MKIIIATIVILLVACKQPDHKTIAIRKKQNLPAAVIDTSRYAILKFDGKSDHYYFDKNSKPTTLSIGECRKIEALILSRIHQYNTDQQENDKRINKIIKEKHPNSNMIYNTPPIINTFQYYKQLIPTINPKNEKVVFVNCFCNASDKSSTNDNSYWRKEIIIVSDGGSCYFQLKINLTIGMVYDLMVNGVA